MQHYRILNYRDNISINIKHDQIKIQNDPQMQNDRQRTNDISNNRRRIMNQKAWWKIFRNEIRDPRSSWKESNCFCISSESTILSIKVVFSRMTIEELWIKKHDICSSIKFKGNRICPKWIYNFLKIWIADASV